MSMKKSISIFIASLLMALTHNVLAANAVIDVLVVYSKGTADAYGGNPATRINQLFQVTNQIYKDSNVNLEIRVAKTMMVNYTDDNSADTALNDITYSKNTAFSGVAAAREEAKADMVIFYRPFKSVQGSCGLAWIGGQSTNGDFSNANIKKFMFSHIAINSCGDFVTAHELGHNMGLKHSRKQDGSGGTFPYALGYGVVNQFTTIMAYQSEFNVDYWTGKLYKFSNPDLTCKGLPCGVSRTNTTSGADARYALNITGPQIEKFYAAPASSSSSVSSKASSSVSSSSLASSKAASSTAISSKISSAVSSKVNIVTSSKASSVLSSAKASSSVKSTVTVASSSSTKATVVISSVKSSAQSSVKVSTNSASSVKKAGAIEFNRIADVAQYSGADWKNEISRSKGLTLDQAKAVAASNPKITYFFIVKEGQMSLGAKGLFRTGDVVFFSGKPWYGAAKGFADIYERKF